MTTDLLSPTPTNKQLAVSHAFCVLQQIVAVGVYIISKEHIFSYIQPNVFIILRVGFLLPILYPLSFIVTGKLFPRKDQLIWVILTGFLFIVMNQSFLFGGLKISGSTNASIISAPCTPMFTALFSVLVGSDKMTIYKAIGFISTIGGALVLLEVENFSFEGKTVGNLLLVGASCCSALISLLQKKLIRMGMHPFSLQANSCCFGLIMYCVVMAPFGIYSPGSWVHLTDSLSIWISIAVVVILGTAIPWVTIMYALKFTSPMTINIYVALQPVIGALMGIFLLGEVFTLRQGLGCTLVLLGLVLVNASPIVQKLMAMITGRPQQTPEGFVVLPSTNPDEEEEQEEGEVEINKDSIIGLGVEMKPLNSKSTTIAIVEDGADEAVVAVSVEDQRKSSN